VRIGLVADTHVPTRLPRLPAALLDGLCGVDMILHAGDLVNLNVVSVLQGIAPTIAVAGNMDGPRVRRALPRQRIARLGGCSVGLQHGHQPHALQRRYIGRDFDAPEMALFFAAMRKGLPAADVIVFGHFHVPVITTWEGCLFVNPGAVAPSHGRSTFALLEIDGEVRARIVDLAGGPSAP